MLKEFKENKKFMEIKMEQASRLADEAANEFIDFIHTLVKDASDEDMKEFLEANDDMVDTEDKIAIIKAYLKTHEDVNGIIFNGVVIFNDVAIFGLK